MPHAYVNNLKLSHSIQLNMIDQSKGILIEIKFVVKNVQQTIFSLEQLQGYKTNNDRIFFLLACHSVDEWKHCIP